MDYNPPNTTNYHTLIPLTSVELNYSLPYWRKWLSENSQSSISIISITYIATIILGQLLMKNRAPFSLRRCLGAWNFFLAIFSLLGTIRTWPELIYILGNHGFKGSVCSRDHHNVASAFWGLLFTLSKAVELGEL